MTSGRKVCLGRLTTCTAWLAIIVVSVTQLELLSSVSSVNTTVTSGMNASSTLILVTSLLIMKSLI